MGSKGRKGGAAHALCRQTLVSLPLTPLKISSRGSESCLAMEAAMNMCVCVLCGCL